MTLIIQRTDFDGLQFRYLSKNLKDEELESLITEAHQLDLRPTLGDAFYTDLINAFPDGDKYDKLVEGEDYDYNGKLVKYDGLKYVALYYTYARYLMNQDAVSTPFGMVTKTNEFSGQLTVKSLQNKIDQSRSAAQSYWLQTLQYLRAKSDDFPIWAKNCGIKTRKGGAIISAVGGHTVIVNRNNRNNQYNG